MNTEEFAEFLWNKRDSSIDEAYIDDSVYYLFDLSAESVELDPWAILCASPGDGPDLSIVLSGDRATVMTKWRDIESATSDEGYYYFDYNEDEDE